MKAKHRAGFAQLADERHPNPSRHGVAVFPHFVWAQECKAFVDNILDPQLDGEVKLALGLHQSPRQRLVTKPGADSVRVPKPVPFLNSGGFMVNEVPRFRRATLWKIGKICRQIPLLRRRQAFEFGYGHTIVVNYCPLRSASALGLRHGRSVDASNVLGTATQAEALIVKPTQGLKSAAAVVTDRLDHGGAERVEWGFGYGTRATDYGGLFVGADLGVHTYDNMVDGSG